MPDQRKIVWIVSDGTGRTAMQVLKAASYQFEGLDVEYRMVTDVTTAEKIADLVERVMRESGMIVYSLVSSANRLLLHRLASENHILSVDLLGPLIFIMQKFLQKIPLELPGLSYKMNRDYYRMVDAVDFTIRHDDGQSVETIENADIILIGPPRVGKTPLAVYLAYMGWKVASIPIVLNLKPPEVLGEVSYKVFCLILDPAQLQRRRIERIKRLGDPDIRDYTELASINEEIAFCRAISEDGKKWPLIDMSYRPVEDIAKEIISGLPND